MQLSPNAFGVKGNNLRDGEYMYSEEADYSKRHSRTIWPETAAHSDQELTGITTTCTP